MRIILLSFSIVALNCSWKDNCFIQWGSGHIAYQTHVFIIAEDVSNSEAWLYCKQMKHDHDYSYPDDKNLYLKGFQVSGYTMDNNVDFKPFKDSFERYCYLPCDGLTLFYNQHPFLKQTLSRIPFLNVLIPYWIKGDAVIMVAVDVIKTSLLGYEGLSSDRFPDIPINIVYSQNDSFVTRKDARVLAYQLNQNPEFANVKLQQASSKDSLSQESIELSDIELQKIVKSYEKRQWWLKNLWACKAGLIISLLPILGIFASRFQSRLFLAFVSLIIEKIVWR